MSFPYRNIVLIINGSECGYPDYLKNYRMKLTNNGNNVIIYNIGK